MKDRAAECRRTHITILASASVCIIILCLLFTSTFWDFFLEMRIARLQIRLRNANPHVVNDIPVDGHLNWYGCFAGLIIQDSPISDISPLKGMNLENLSLCRTSVKDLSPLRGMPLLALHLSNTKVADLTPLQGMPLVAITIHNTPAEKEGLLAVCVLRPVSCTAACEPQAAGGAVPRAGHHVSRGQRPPAA